MTSERPAVRGVVFDLDGTLVDSWPLHLRSLRCALAAVGLPRATAAALATAQRATDAGTVRALTGEDPAEAAFDAYRRALRRLLAGAAVPAVAHAAETVRRLRAAGLVVGVCTGRSRREAQALLDASGIGGLRVTVAREDADPPKPAPDGLVRALWLLGLTPAETVYVGDSRDDAAQGRAAGVRTFVLGDRQAEGRIDDLSRLPAVLGMEDS